MSAEARVHADTRARRLAQTLFERPLVLEAGAGTGKTAALVSRIVAWSMGPGWARSQERLGAAPGPGRADPSPERIAAEVLRRVVAITFTEAAAAEMSDRVSGAFSAIAEGSAPVWIDLDFLPPEPGERASRARALLGALDQLAVRTIHGFCRRLLAENPIEAGLHPQFVIDADDTQRQAVVHEVLERALPDALADPHSAVLVLARGGVDFRQLEEALDVFTREALPAAAFDIDPFAADRIDDLRERAVESLAALLAASEGQLDELKGQARSISNDVATMRVALEAWAVQRLTTRGELEAWSVEVSDPDSAIAKRVSKWAQKNFGTTAGNALGERADAFAHRAADLRRILKHLSSIDVELVDRAREALGPLVEQVNRELRSRGIESFASLLVDARDLLRAHPEVARRERARTDQFLVDEFQDTDRTQCELLESLVLEAPKAERPGLFLVGDPKQSIYGWRQADLAAYTEFVARVRAAGGESHPLIVNFRSAPPILAEVDRLIAPLMHEEAGIQPGFESLLPCPERERDEGFRKDGFAPVEHWTSWRWDRDAQAPARTRSPESLVLEGRALAQDLLSLHHQHEVRWQDVGVLLRTKTDLEPILAALRDAGIPFLVEGDRSYYRRREIIDAAALVRCVIDPNDQLALLTVLRSPMVGVPDAALLPLWARGFPGRVRDLREAAQIESSAIETLVAEAASAVPEEVPGIERVMGWDVSLRAAIGEIAALRESFDRDPADVFVDALRTRLSFEVTQAVHYLGAYRLANLDRFFRDLRIALDEGDGDPQRVLRALRSDVAEQKEEPESRLTDAAEDAVRILSIHKAKGLDFRHVYLLQAHKAGGGNRSEKTAVAAARAGYEYRIFGAPTLGWDRIEAERSRVESAERVRTLYVALTRAKERLVVSGLRRAYAAQGSAQSHVALLEARREGTPDLGRHMQELGREARDATIDLVGARWTFPDLPGFHSDQPISGRRVRRALFEVAAVRAGADALRAHRREAARRMARTFRGAASASTHENLVEQSREGRDEFGASGVPRRAAPGSTDDETPLRVGTAIHRLLERFDLRADPSAEMARRREDLDRELARTVTADALAAARDRATALLDRFAEGPLLEALCRLADHVVARELPVLLPPDRDGHGPVGFVAGAVDLLYRDPDSGAWVVADYKTDRVESESEIAERVATYRAQGSVYLRAVAEALELPELPRFELWFLHPGRIERTVASPA